MARRIAEAAVAVVGVILAFEGAAQVYWWQVFEPESRRRTQLVDHVYGPSDNPVLGYELKPGYSYEKHGKRVSINRQGIRDDDQGPAPGAWKIGLLGASVVFGFGHDQADTISEGLEAALGGSRQRVQAVNLGVPGYGLDEHLEHLRVRDEVYELDHVVYVHHLIDFCRRDTRFEGGDSGIYRRYNRPGLLTPWIVRKLIYRWHKGGSLLNPDPASAGWYSWLYHGNRDHGLATIVAMRDYAEDRGAGFSLAILPSRYGFVEGRDLLGPVYREIADFARREGVEVMDFTAVFPPEWIDETDHLTPEGNARLGELIAESLRPVVEPLPDGSAM